MFWKNAKFKILKREINLMMFAWEFVGIKKMTTSRKHGNSFQSSLTDAASFKTIFSFRNLDLSIQHTQHSEVYTALNCCIHLCDWAKLTFG